MPFIKSPFTHYKKLLLPRCRSHAESFTIRSESFHYFGEKLMMMSKRDFYSCLQCGKAWVASGPDQWPTVVNFIQLQTKKQPVISTIVKGQNFNTEHGNNSGDCFSFCRVFKSELKCPYRLAGLQHCYTDLKPAQSRTPSVFPFLHAEDRRHWERASAHPRPRPAALLCLASGRHTSSPTGSMRHRWHWHHQTIPGIWKIPIVFWNPKW